MKQTRDDRDSIEFDWQIGSLQLLVQAKAKVIGGDYYQGPRLTDFSIEVFPLDQHGHLIEDRHGFRQLYVLDFGKDDWNEMESYAETMLFEDARERGVA